MAAEAHSATLGWSRKSPADATLVLIVVNLTLVGVLAVFSASWPFDSRPLPDGTPGDPYRTLVRQALHAGIGGLLCVLFSYLPPHAFGRAAKVGLFSSIVLMGLCFSRWGVSAGGAHRWLRLGPVVFQPSELAKLALILYLARCVTTPKDWPRKQSYTFLAALVATITVSGLCLLQKDLGSAALAFAFGMVVLFYAGGRWHLIGAAWLLGSLACFYFAWIEPYRWRRITAFLHPTCDIDDSAYHVTTMLIACARGGLIGPGPGLSREKWLGLPNAHNDAIYCVIASELGFIGAAILAIVFLWLMFRTLDLARRQPDRFATILLSSLGSCIVLQAFVNMAVATGCLPCTGINLPFISAGGSSLVVTLIASGMMLSLSRQATLDRAGISRHAVDRVSLRHMRLPGLASDI